MATDIEAAFQAIRWQHIRTVESMQALTERNVELEREVFNHAQAMKAEKLKRKKAFDELKAGVKEMFRLLKGELEVSRTLVYTQSAMCHNDNAKLVGRLGRKAEQLLSDNNNLTFSLKGAQGQIQRMQDRLLQYEGEFSGDLKDQLAIMKAELQNERARSVMFERKCLDSKSKYESKLADAEKKYKALDAVHQTQTRKFNFMEAEHVSRLNALREECDDTLAQKDGEISMLKQFIADRDKRIEHLIAELEKAKSQTMGGSSFKKYVQLKSQNVELQNEVEVLSKQVSSTKNAGGRGGRRAGGARAVLGESSQHGPVVGQTAHTAAHGALGINPSSLVTDSVGSDFADERLSKRGSRHDPGQRHPTGSFTSSQSATSRRRGGAGLDPSLLSPSSSATKLPIGGIASVNQNNNTLSNGNLNIPSTGSREEEDVFGEDLSFGDAYRAPRRKRQPTGFDTGLPAQRQAERSHLPLTNSASFGGREAVKANASEQDLSGSLSARAAVESSEASPGIGVVGTSSLESISSPNRKGSLKLSPRSPRNRSHSPGKANASLSSGPAYDPAESLFPAASSPIRRAMNNAATDLEISGTDAPRLKAVYGGSADRDRSRSRSPSSPRRHIGEYENKKATKLTFV